MKFSFLSSVAFLSIILVFSMPFISMAQEQKRSDAAQGRIDGNLDAELEVDAGAWFFAGFLCGIFAIGGAMVYEPPINPVRLMGKSPDYIMNYTHAYKGTAAEKQTGASFAGCLIGSGISLAYILYVAEDE